MGWSENGSPTDLDPLRSIKRYCNNRLFSTLGVTKGLQTGEAGLVGQYVPMQHQSSLISKDKRVKMLILLPYCYAICLTRHPYSVRRSILPLYCFFPTSPSFGGLCYWRRPSWPLALWLSCFSLRYFLSSDSGWRTLSSRLISGAWPRHDADSFYNLSDVGAKWDVLCAVCPQKHGFKNLQIWR